MKIVECVPNFSEGKNSKIIKRISEAISSIAGAELLDVDAGFDTNRTVFTFAGEPGAVFSAAFNAIKEGVGLIDMSVHKGAHPRMGACDVCPFVPVSGISMAECVELSLALGEKVGAELNIPVYLYEHAARSPERKNLANIRSGEYEALEEKLKRPEWKPDFGPYAYNEQVKRSGAAVIGAREVLIAYNININSKDKKLASRIAGEIRERGKTVKDVNGNTVRAPGKLKHCRAIGWYVDDYKRAQVSVNLTDYHITGMHHAFDAAVEAAAGAGVRITGSEIVGLVPEQALIEAGLYYIKKQRGSTACSEKEIIETAAASLGLGEVAPFDPREKIIEYRIRGKSLLSELQVDRFMDELASFSQAPGGGAVSALAGSIASALVSMVGNVTYKNRRYVEVWEEAESTAFLAHRLKDRLLDLVDKDTEAFNKIMAAMRLPKTGKREIEIRNEALEAAVKGAILSPYAMMKLSEEVLPLLEKISKIGNRNALSEMAMSARMLRSALYGAYYNILINFKSLTDTAFRKKILSDAEDILKNADSIIDSLIAELEKELKSFGS